MALTYLNLINPSFLTWYDFPVPDVRNKVFVLRVGFRYGLWRSSLTLIPAPFLLVLTLGWDGIYCRGGVATALKIVH